MYTEKLMEHFRNPRNYGRIDDADGVGKVGNPVCGDVMYLYIKVDDGRISDIKFETFGCAAAIATSSIVTEMVKGKTIEEALQITNKTVAEALGGLPPIKVHCSLLAEEGLKAAIWDYYQRNGIEPPPGLLERLKRLKRVTDPHAEVSTTVGISQDDNAESDENGSSSI
ncbi:MAG TPA: Fe-S cluster assembly scaffold protein NifU, partial [Armatimonadetes bacterium]|nr:Fe-S cluster assembly scaffold protein NifU [Armatimonadota bacterium]